MVGNYFHNSAQEFNALDFLQQRDEIAIWLILNRLIVNQYGQFLQFC